MPKDPFPTPGQPVRGSKTGRPIMALLDLLGRSWAMGVLWNLGEGPATFRELRHRCEAISPTVLNRRLKELRQAQCVETSPEGYRLTATGRDLLDLLKPLGAWSKHWAAQLAEPPGRPIRSPTGEDR